MSVAHHRVVPGAGRFDGDAGPHAEALIDCLESWAPDADRRPFHARLDAIVAATRFAFRRAEAPELAAAWRRRFHPYFLQAPWIARAFHKPLGYAGDFELMHMTYRKRLEGPTPLGRALHLWANSFRRASAVRSGRRWILDEMQSHARDHMGPYRILSMASGPAVEVQDLVRDSFLAERAGVLCVDQDTRSLAYARTEIARVVEETGLDLPVYFSANTVNRLLLTRGKGDGYGMRDFVYAPSLRVPVLCAASLRVGPARRCSEMVQPPRTSERHASVGSSPSSGSSRGAKNARACVAPGSAVSKGPSSEEERAERTSVNRARCSGSRSTLDPCPEDRYGSRHMPRAPGLNLAPRD